MSNQKLKLDFNEKRTEVFVGESEAEYLKIQKLYRVLNECNNTKTKVFVHCAMGMSRSATSVIMFLMKQFHMKLSTACDYVKAHREIVDPNDGFMEQLKRFENCHFRFLTEIDESESDVSPNLDISQDNGMDNELPSSNNDNYQDSEYD